MKLFTGIEYDIIKGHELLYQQAYTELKDFIIKHKDEIRKSISDSLIKGDYKNLKYSHREDCLVFKNVDSILSSKELSLTNIITNLNEEFFDEDIFLESIHRRISRHFSIIIFNFKIPSKFEKKIKKINESVVVELTKIKKIFNKQI